MKVLALCAAALAFGTPALAQSFNIDVGDPTLPSPSMAYAAGTAQSGVWNAWGNAGNSIPHTQALVDITGAATGVSMTGDYATFTNGLGNFNFNNGNTFGDDEALLDDLWDMGAPAGEGVFTITGLADGEYDIFSYSFAPDSAAFSTTVSVSGSPDPPQLVNDPTGFGGGHGLGITYAKHRVTVSGGSNVEVFFLAISGFGSSNGIQITAESAMSLGTNYCVGAVNSTGSGALMSATGSDSVSANDLTLTAGPVPDQPGLFFFGPSQVQVPFGNGFLCVGNPFVRINPPSMAVGNLATRVVDLPTFGLMPGTSEFQYWFRDPPAGGELFNLSDGLEIVFVP